MMWKAGVLGSGLLLILASSEASSLDGLVVCSDELGYSPLPAARAKGSRCHPAWVREEIPGVREDALVFLADDHKPGARRAGEEGEATSLFANRIETAQPPGSRCCKPAVH
jgi:hypothetical protein